ncbi:MAG TPA: histidine phosphatase family protein [Myxococcota bacterium]|jgi:broad specificity phosphatase PhoE
MAIPKHLTEAAARHRTAGRRAGIVVRHAERFHVDDLRTHESVLLTERGHAQARDGGALLHALGEPLTIFHSPVERCAETARGLVAGVVEAGGHATLAGPLLALYSTFILDKHKAWETVQQLGHSFIRDWFDDKLPPDVFEPRARAAQGQLDALAHALIEQPACVFVSHDWNIALVREDVLAFSPEHGWPGFLDGYVVALDGDDIVVEYDGRVGRRRRHA